ncbi:hypothetical protein [Pandoraea anapnoica]|uniref:hypothetical protein n=1 Tax=Pandoraea anapnoica TaxID=2508301 RepID=UPI0012410C0B|nr:hypothetical protein [Pandoraea anapnoica]
MCAAEAVRIARRCNCFTRAADTETANAATTNQLTKTTTLLPVECSAETIRDEPVRIEFGGKSKSVVSAGRNCMKLQWSEF